MPGERNNSRGEGRQEARQAQPKRIQAHQKNIPGRETPFLQRSNDAANQAERRRQPRAGVGVNFQTHFFLGPGRYFMAKGPLVILEKLLHGVTVVAITEIAQFLLPDGRSRGRLFCRGGRKSANEGESKSDFIQE